MCRGEAGFAAMGGGRSIFVTTGGVPVYQALYRKYRPRTFSEVVGQSHITDTLQRQVAEGRVGHAYLFTGTRGTGKTTCARILAKAVNCQHPVDGAPCCRCDSCRGIDAGTLLDVTELDAASNGSVNDARTLREEAVYPPSVLKKRVYIIDEVHMLSRDAFNALLKIMEEPPEHLLFILATTELHKVPATILSRCQRFSFKRILPRDAEQQLLKIAAAEDIALTSDGAEILARMANGALRDALSLLDQCRAADGDIDSRTVLDTLGLAGSTQTLQLMRCLLARNAADALALFDQLYRSGKDVAALLGELSDLSRDMTVLKAAPEGGAALLSGGFDSATLDQLGKDVPSNRFLYLASTLQKAAADLYYSADRRTDAELCLLRLCDESLCGDLTALKNRITRLEDAAARGAAISAAVNQSVSAAKAIGAAPVSQAPAKPASKPVEPPPAEAPPPWDEPPLPEEPPMREEPGERVFDIPEDAIPVRPAQPKAVPAKPAASIPSAPKPQTAVHSAAPVSGDWWKALSENCKGQIPPMYRAFLDLCGGVLEGDQLTVFAPDEITLNRLDNDRVRGVLSAEAEKVSGQPVRLLLREGEPPKPSPEENLKQLLQFGSQFDNIEIK